VQVALCKVERPAFDGFDLVGVVAVFLEPVVMRGPIDADRVASCRHDAERPFEGFKHLLFFGVGFGGF